MSSHAIAAAAMAWELIEGDSRLLNAPRKARPIGVRAAETITASFITIAFLSLFNVLYFDTLT
jgi:hypothetical protein